MDAHGLLRSQGWRGLGYTLKNDTSKTGHGLARPLLLSRKDDRLGLGSQNVHNQAAATDQWWLDAFDQQLNRLAAGGDGKLMAAASSGATRLDVLASGHRGVANKYRGAYGLYASFVRGGLIDGTLTQSDNTSTTTFDEDISDPSQDDMSTFVNTSKTHTKRKRGYDDTDNHNNGCKAEKRRRHEEKRAKEVKKDKKRGKRAEGAEMEGQQEKRSNDHRRIIIRQDKNASKKRNTDKKQLDANEESVQVQVTNVPEASDALQHKETQRTRKDEEKLVATTKKQVKESKEERKARKAEKKKLKGGIKETKEQRRARKEAKKAEREARSALKRSLEKAKEAADQTESCMIAKKRP